MAIAEMKHYEATLQAQAAAQQQQQQNNHLSSRHSSDTIQEQAKLRLTSLAAAPTHLHHGHGHHQHSPPIHPALMSPHLPPLTHSPDLGKLQALSHVLSEAHHTNLSRTSPSSATHQKQSFSIESLIGPEKGGKDNSNQQVNNTSSSSGSSGSSSLPSHHSSSLSAASSPSAQEQLVAAAAQHHAAVQAAFQQAAAAAQLAAAANSAAGLSALKSGLPPAFPGHVSSFTNLQNYYTSLWYSRHFRVTWARLETSAVEQDCLMCSCLTRQTHLWHDLLWQVCNITYWQFILTRCLLFNLNSLLWVCSNEWMMYKKVSWLCFSHDDSIKPSIIPPTINTMLPVSNWGLKRVEGRKSFNSLFPLICSEGRIH